jgi:diadenosine tetraphosphate (Ap4A) HIT family hydrolase
MFDSNCIFCKIIQKQIPSKIIKEDETVLVIEDIAPKAPYHYLIIPKKHIINVNYLTEQDEKLAWPILKAARDIAKEIQEKSGQKDPISFNLVSNNGAFSGQSVFHIHWHFLSGKKLKSVAQDL